MAALLVAMSIMAVMMTVVMPVWKQTTQREKETELIFRGQQYARAIGLFQRKYANAFPPNLDVLVDQKFLRKKFKDPIAGDDFTPLTQAQGNAPGTGTATSQRPGTAPTTTGPQTSTTTTASGGFGTSAGPAGPAGGIVGVTSKSKEKSIRIYNGRTHYNEWAFIFTPQNQAPGTGGAPGQPGRPGQGQQPGQPGTPGRPGQTPNVNPRGFGPGDQGAQPLGRPGQFQPPFTPPPIRRPGNI